MELVVAALQEQDFLEGSKLSKQLQAQAPDLTLAVKNQLGGKGWLKRLLQEEPRVCVAQVEGLNEPCYCIADGSGQPIRHFDRPPRNPEGYATSFPREDATDVTNKVSAEDLGTILATAVQAIEISGKSQVNGAELSGMMSSQDPELVNRVRSQLGGKGWLKTVLSLEPRIALIAGMGEMAYALSNAY